jgi:type I restriction enzyme S subunit
VSKIFPEHWNVFSFSEAVKDATADYSKLQKSDYLEQGAFPIVDQGRQHFGGYTNDESIISRVNLPAIVFGDHTRIFKFIEEPFCLGADGAKVLEPKGKLDKKFLFYYLSSLNIESAGYSRHFKFLKENVVPVPSLSEQKRIATILDKADSIRRKRQKAIQLADDFICAVFLDMFGDPNSNSKRADILSMAEVFDIKTGKLNSNAAIEGGKYPFFTCAKEIFAIDDYAFDQEALLLAGNNAQADYDVKYYKGRFDAYQRTYVLTLRDSEWSYPFYKFALQYQLSNLKRASKGSNTKYITMEIMARTMLPVPSKGDQKKFVEHFDRVQAIQAALLVQAQNDENLFSALSYKAFTGQL